MIKSYLRIEWVSFTFNLSEYTNIIQIGIIGLSKNKKDDGRGDKQNSNSKNLLNTFNHQ